MMRMRLGPGVAAAVSAATGAAIGTSDVRSPAQRPPPPRAGQAAKQKSPAPCPELEDDEPWLVVDGMGEIENPFKAPLSEEELQVAMGDAKQIVFERNQAMKRTDELCFELAEEEEEEEEVLHLDTLQANAHMARAELSLIGSPMMNELFAMVKTVSQDPEVKRSFLNNPEVQRILGQHFSQGPPALPSVTPPGQLPEPLCASESPAIPCAPETSEVTPFKKMQQMFHKTTKGITEGIHKLADTWVHAWDDLMRKLHPEPQGIEDHVWVRFQLIGEGSVQVFLSTGPEPTQSAPASSAETSNGEHANPDLQTLFVEAAISFTVLVLAIIAFKRIHNRAATSAFVSAARAAKNAGRSFF